MENIGKIIKQYGVFPPLLIAFLAIYFISKMFRGGKKRFSPSNLFESDEQQQAKKTVEDVQKREAESSKVFRTLTDSQAEIVANNIKNALLGGWFSEDEETIIENVQKIKNQGDYDIVSAKYGYVENWRFISSRMTMIQHMRDLLGGDDLEFIENWFKSHKISV